MGEFHELRHSLESALHSIVKHRFFQREESAQAVLLKLQILERDIANYKAALGSCENKDGAQL